MIVYHGSNQVVEMPDIYHSYRSLDFGKGFYVTTNREQALKWAKRKSVVYSSEKSYINVYEMQDIPNDLSVKTFDDDLTEWIDFVCNCRDGNNDYLDYDIIIGKVADDKVFRVVDMYHSGIWDINRALKEISVYPTYDQIAFISQKSIDKILKFKSYEEV